MSFPEKKGVFHWPTAKVPPFLFITAVSGSGMNAVQYSTTHNREQGALITKQTDSSLSIRINRIRNFSDHLSSPDAQIGGELDGKH